MKMTDEIRSQINGYSSDIEKAKAEIADLKTNSNVTFQTNPNSLSHNLSSLSSESSKVILNALPDNITGYQKFAMFYEELYKKTQALGISENIGQDYLDRVGDRVKDVVDVV